MLSRIKTAIQGRLYDKCIEEYERQLRCYTDPYLIWIRENEQDGKAEDREEQEPELGVVYMEDCGRSFSVSELDKEYLLFVSKEGRIAPGASREVMQYFRTHKGVNVVYADEDAWMLGQHEASGKKQAGNPREDERTHRLFPWTKPMWSPDTLFSFLYFGNIFAVRREACLDLEWLGDWDYRKNIYDFVLKATERGGRPGHIEKILFHAYKRGDSRSGLEETLMHETDFIGVGKAYDAIRESALSRRGLRGTMVVDGETQISYPVYELPEKPLVSIVIPSKDNQEVLKQCIRSIYAHTDYPGFEIIVVDNGSTARVRVGLENFRQECPFTYLYIPMEFNFSRMCNAGVKEAGGEYILLLNDDMEVIEESWLTRMVGQASLRHVGAVGAKLLYPGSPLIQHVGVTNTVYGPGHKLKQCDDSVSYYYGRNRFIYDMIGVTGACLLMRRDYYVALGGLYEGLAVAYNDVDLCFRLCSKGLYNVQRNDVVLYHHESLSRGDDMQDEGKLKRLKAEKNELYKRHPKFYGKDPFIGTLMNDGEPQYQCRYGYDEFELYHIADSAGKVRKGKKLPEPDAMNQTLFVWTEECGAETISGRTGYLVKGWAYMPGLDNARYAFVLLFCDGQGTVWELPTPRRYRRDVAAVLQGEKNVDMPGFCCWISDGELPDGVYDVWLMAKDCCSRQRLYKNMERKLEVDHAKLHGGSV